MRVCRLRDPERDSCIKNSIQNVLPELVANPSFFIPLEPLVNDLITVDLNNAFVSGGFSLTNVKIHGASLGQVKNVKSSFSDFGMKLQLDLAFPKLSTTGAYKSDIFLTAIKILSKGKFDVSLFNVKSKWTMKGKLVNRGVEQYMEIFETDIVLDIKDVKMNFTGVFENDSLSKWKLVLSWNQT